MAVFFLCAAIFSAEPAPTLPGFHEYEQQLSSLLKQVSQAKSQATRAEFVGELCQLHQNLVRDPRYATSDVLKEYRHRIWSRLVKAKADVQRELARTTPKGPRGEKNRESTAIGPVELFASDSLSVSLALLDELQGGPGQWIARGGGPVAPDWGPGLVDLIERTIHPAFWDVAGGPGTIVYYRPLHCLVVRATSEVHGQLGGMVGDLRAAGK